MSSEATSYRWWENYLVRYLMPSIAGVAIVIWLTADNKGALRAFLLLPSEIRNLNTASLALLFLYGNLFCYIASYPILCFHVTRVLDQQFQKWRHPYLVNGYICTVLLMIGACVVAFTVPSIYEMYAAFGLAAIFVVLQLARLLIVRYMTINVEGLEGMVSPVFGYAYALSRRRGIEEEEQKEKIKQNSATVNAPARDVENYDAEATTLDKWQRDLIDTYRHLREHGNSAFIFTLEITLAALCYCVISSDASLEPTVKLSRLGILLVVWALPSMCVHAVGQHMERRFSWFDRRVE